MSLNEVLEKLKKQYISELPEKIAHLEQLAGEDNFVELSKEFHKLKGSGKTYGLDEVSLIAEPLEYICKSDGSSCKMATTLGLELLKKTYDERSQGNALDVEAEGNFLEIKDLFKAAS